MLKMLSNDFKIINQTDFNKVKITAAGKTLKIFLRKDDTDIN